MPPQALLQALQQKPFIPFRLHVSDGATYIIRHPDLVLVAPGYVIIGVPPATPQAAMIERHEVVSLGHITRLEPTPATTPPGNGQ
jgi:hypothetical protein